LVTHEAFVEVLLSEFSPYAAGWKRGSALHAQRTDRIYRVVGIVVTLMGIAAAVAAMTIRP